MNVMQVAKTIIEVIMDKIATDSFLGLVVLAKITRGLKVTCSWLFLLVSVKLYSDSSVLITSNQY